MDRERDVSNDRDKVRAEARKLDGTGLRVWLDRAIDMLPDEACPEQQREALTEYLRRRLR